MSEIVFFVDNSFELLLVLVYVCYTSIWSKSILLGEGQLVVAMAVSVRFMRVNLASFIRRC